MTQQVKTVYIYLLLKLENSKQTTAIPFEIVISITRCKYTHETAPLGTTSQ